MTRKKDAVYGIKRLESKNARAAILQKIAADFHLAPLMAEAYYTQMSSYFEEHANVHLSWGQICYEAVAAEEPAGKHIVLAKKVSCRLMLNDVQEDFEVLADYGLPNEPLTSIGTAYIHGVVAVRNSDATTGAQVQLCNDEVAVVASVAFDQLQVQLWKRVPT